MPPLGTDGTPGRRGARFLLLRHSCGCYRDLHTLSLQGDRRGNTGHYLRAAFLEHVGRTQVNEDLLRWQCQSDRGEGNADAFLNLADGLNAGNGRATDLIEWYLLALGKCYAENRTTSGKRAVNA